MLAEVTEVASGRRDADSGATVTADSGDIWLVRAVSPKSSEFGVIAINLGRESREGSNEMRIRVDAVLADATATLERLGVAHAISEARMRSQTDQLREALIGSVSHELRTPLASILGAATVLSAAPALANEKKLKALVHDVRDEAERLNNDIQNLLDASRITQRRRQAAHRMGRSRRHRQFGDRALPPPHGDRRLVLNLPADLPLVHVDPVLVQQALVQIFDNAVKYSPAGSQITVARARARRPHDPERRRRGRRPDRRRTDARSGSASRAANATPRPPAAPASACGSPMPSSPPMAARSSAVSDGPGLGTTVSIELPVTQAAVPQMEGDADE